MAKKQQEANVRPRVFVASSSASDWEDTANKIQELLQKDNLARATVWRYLFEPGETPI